MATELLSAIMALGPEPQKIVRQDLDSILDFADVVARLMSLDRAVWKEGNEGFHYPNLPKINHRTKYLFLKNKDQEKDGLGSLVLELFDAVKWVNSSLRPKRIEWWQIEALAVSGKVCMALYTLIEEVDRSTAVVATQATSTIADQIGREPSAQPTEPSHPRGIPPEMRTRPMSKSEVARILGRRGNKKRLAEWTTDCISRGVLRHEEINRQSGFYHIDDFPGHEDKVCPK